MNSTKSKADLLTAHTALCPDVCHIIAEYCQLDDEEKLRYMLRYIEPSMANHFPDHIKIYKLPGSGKAVDAIGGSHAFVNVIEISFDGFVNSNGKFVLKFLYYDPNYYQREAIHWNILADFNDDCRYQVFAQNKNYSLTVFYKSIKDHSISYYFNHENRFGGIKSNIPFEEELFKYFIEGSDMFLF